MIATLKLNHKIPNFQDARVAKRANLVLDWCDQFVGSKREMRVSSEELRRVFSNKDRGLGSWLYSTLLIQVGTYQVGSHPYSYSLKIEGYQKLCGLLGREVRSETDVVRQRFQPVLDGRAVEYHDNGLRRFHPVQNIRRDVRKQVFDGWWDYDVESCAPTLVYQYAVSHYRWVYGVQSAAEPFPSILRLINDKAHIRQHVSSLTGLDVSRSKQILQMLFFRANPGMHASNALYSTLGNDPYIFQKLVNDDYVQALRLDAKAMWRYAIARDTHERASLRMSGIKSSTPVSGIRARRMNIYLSLERRVMDAIFRQLSADGVTHVIMHDGFMSRDKVDVGKLTRLVKDEMGYEIRLSETRLGQHDELEPEIDVEQAMQEVDVEDDNEFNSDHRTDKPAFG
ncbi:hypothetical protein FBZ89_109227 [Nitrospirillum amazonense]|uniref:Uncharacterized protein n=1 Tax=Nitrospirillum amazonense TaxID=28077 RepID=A0A560FB81_9PROT|nr:hypothetical protein [Nitrospirillum amazonense]TWB18840.1 hypothetical protein FBZ89_109227 [Nitrospirillum amazonense]